MVTAKPLDPQARPHRGQRPAAAAARHDRHRVLGRRDPEDRAAWPSISAGSKPSTASSLAVRRGTVHALIGPNGLGQDDVPQRHLRPLPPDRRTHRLQGPRHHRDAAPHQRTAGGLMRTFQNIRVFRGMTVLDNVMIGAERRGNDVRPAMPRVVERALAALDFVGLRGISAEAAGRVAVLRPPALRRDRPRAGRLARDAAARRTRRRPQPRPRNRRWARCSAPQRPRPHHPDHRPRHEPDRSRSPTTSPC